MSRSNVPVARPKIVGLCGSLRFVKELTAERTRSTLDLAIVLAPEATRCPGSRTVLRSREDPSRDGVDLIVVVPHTRAAEVG
ncbi:hypothetical protein BA895_03775 [Humibacillus sp. DSM 29435]|nr:hypothetical protein BA895_03775 [Humibacillus sp. DSM 29435]